MGFGSRQDVAVIIVLNFYLCGSVAVGLLFACLRGFERAAGRPRAENAVRYIGTGDGEADRAA
jgi:hypothetical protein